MNDPSEVETQASATILKLAPIYFRFQGRQGHFNVPESVKNNKKLTLKLCWLSLIKAVFCLLCFIGPICIWLQWMSVRLPGTQTSSRHSKERRELKTALKYRHRRQMGRWREKEALSCSSIFQGYININTIQFETRAGGILNLNSSNIQIRALCVHFVWESVSWDQCYTFKLFLCNKLIAIVRVI